MSYEYQIHPERNLVTVTYTGRTTADDSIACMSAVLADPLYRPGMSAISEYRDASGEWRLEDLDKFRSFVASIKERIGKSRWAVVIPEGRNTASARIVIALHNALDSTIEIQLFRDHETAMEWLEKTPA